MDTRRDREASSNHHWIDRNGAGIGKNPNFRGSDRLPRKVLKDESVASDVVGLVLHRQPMPDRHRANRLEPQQRVRPVLQSGEDQADQMADPGLQTLVDRSMKAWRGFARKLLQGGNQTSECHLQHLRSPNDSRERKDRQPIKHEWLANRTKVAEFSSVYVDHACVLLTPMIVVLNTPFVKMTWMI